MAQSNFAADRQFVDLRREDEVVFGQPINGWSEISIATGGWGFLEERFARSAEAQARAGAVVEQSFRPAHLGKGDVPKVGPLGKVLAE